MSGARVRSSDALAEFRGGVVAFRERAQAALGSLRQEALKTLRWLEQEQPQYWQQQQRLGYDRLASARVAYETCRMRTVAGHRSACIEEKVALQRAKARLEYVQQQVEAVRRWSHQAGDQVNEFFGKLNPLERMLEDDVVQMVAVLERLILSVEAYAAEAGAPEGEPQSRDEGQPE
jgi:hypothetical protein